MSKLIPFPSQIAPHRLTQQLIRTDETFNSPATGIQQTASRGNAYWQWSIEYRDISLSERDIVESFLMGCKGSLNHFKVPDAANYYINGVSSSWTDVFSGHGEFLNSDDLNFFTKSGALDRALLSGGGVRGEWKSLGSTFSMYRQNQQLTAGASYLIRAKVLGNDYPMNIRFNVGSNYNTVFGPHAVRSDTDISVPFFADATTQTLCGIFFGTTATFSGRVGDLIDVHSLRCSRVALISNSENLLTRSNEFDHADWTLTRCGVESGFADDPMGVDNLWRMYVNSDEISGTHFIQQTYSKIATEGLYTLSIYARFGAGLSKLRVQMTDGDGNTGHANFDINVGSMESITQQNSYWRVFGKVWDVGSDTYRCQTTAVVTSKNIIRCNIQALNSDGTTTFSTVDTSYIEIYGAQLREFPHMGQYVPTVATAVVGTGYQTGSRLVLEGFDANEYAFRANTRLEIFNRYYDDTDVIQRTEFKRLTKDLKSSKDGHAIAYVDPPIRNAPVPLLGKKANNFENEYHHNAVLFDKPEIKARLAAPTIQIIEKPLQLADVIFDVIEDLTE